MKTTKPHYHHGDLACACLDAAIKRIAIDGVEKLSLRAVARDLGVSQTAPYRHFNDKTHLLTLLAQQGFELLAEQTKQATVDQHGGLQESMMACGLAYLNFAKHHPEHYRLMFGGRLQRQCGSTDLADTSLSAFDVILEQVTFGVEQGFLVQEDPRLLARTLWSTVHGMAMLMIDGFYSEYPDEELTPFLQTMLTHSVTGILA